LVHLIKESLYSDDVLEYGGEEYTGPRVDEVTNGGKMLNNKKLYDL